MLKLSISPLALILAGLALLASTTTLAEDDRWFQVELLAFTNQPGVPPAGAELAEQWEATPALTYPTASRFLVDPEQVAINRAKFMGESVLDEYGRQIISVFSQAKESSGGLADEARLLTDEGGAQPGGETTNAVPGPLVPVFEGALPAPVAQALPRPFVMLPPGYQEFRGKAALMQRGGDYTILFHQTWVQPVPPEDNSLPIVLDRSGDDQQWPQLQGSVKIFLSRYLQLETNLWLNTAGDYLPGTWQMPAPPFGPRSLIVEEEEVVDIEAGIEALQATMPPPADAGSAIATIETVDESATATMAPRTDANPLAGELAAEIDTQIAEEAAGPAYPFRHAVLLQQKRRMRSNEVHYIDHPLLGLIIKFTPVSDEQLAEIAAAQERSLAAGQTL